MSRITNGQRFENELQEFTAQVTPATEQPNLNKDQCAQAMADFYAKVITRMLKEKAAAQDIPEQLHKNLYCKNLSAHDGQFLMEVKTPHTGSLCITKRITSTRLLSLVTDINKEFLDTDDKAHLIPATALNRKLNEIIKKQSRREWGISA